MKYLKILFALILGFSLVACTSKEAKPDVLRVALFEYPKNLSPIKIENHAEAWMQSQIYENLYQIVDGVYVPVLAKALPEFSSDNRSCVIEVADGIKFHDGSSLDADAVVYSLQHPTSMQNTPWINPIESVSKVDATHVKITLRFPDGTLLAKLASPYLAIIPTDSDNEGQLSEFPIGTGPYKYVSSENGKSISLTRFDNYHGEVAKITQIEGIVVNDINEALTKLRDGEIDLVDEVPVSAKKIVDGIKELQWIEAKTSSSVYLGIRQQNLLNPKLGSSEFRQTISKVILEGFHENDGLSLFGAGVFPKSSQTLVGNVDLDKWLDQDIHLIASELGTSGSDVKDALVEAGFSKVTLEPLNQQTFLTRSMGNDGYDLMVFSWDEQLSEGTLLLDNLFGADAGNPLRYQNATVESWILAATRTIDPVIRGELLGKIQQELLNDGVLLPVKSVMTYIAADKQLGGIQVMPNRTLPLARITRTEE